MDGWSHAAAETVCHYGVGSASMHHIVDDKVTARKRCSAWWDAFAKEDFDWSERNTTCDALSRMTIAGQLPAELRTVERTSRRLPEFKVLNGRSE